MRAAPAGLSIGDHGGREAANAQSKAIGDTIMASGNDMRAANNTYSGFLTMFKWGAIATALVTVFVIVMIT